MNFYKAGVVLLAATVAAEWGNPALGPQPHVETPEAPVMYVMTAEMITTLSGTAATIIGNTKLPGDVK